MKESIALVIDKEKITPKALTGENHYPRYSFPHGLHRCPISQFYLYGILYGGFIGVTGLLSWC